MDVVSRVVLLAVVLFTLAFFSTSAQTQNQTCVDFNATSCDKCTGAFDGTKCFWCDSDKMCRDWKWGRGHILPTGTDCGGYNWNYRSCTLNGVAYAVIIGIVLLIIVLIITCFVICCCVWCARRKKRSWRRQQERYEDERKEINERASQRRAERKTRTDEIRRKYGLENA